VKKLSTETEINQDAILQFLYQDALESDVERWVNPENIHEVTHLKPTQINDAVKLLHDSGLVEWLRALATKPYNFAFIKITPQGKYEVERRKVSKESKERLRMTLNKFPDFFEIISEELERVRSKPPLPIGSPYGFTDFDWEIVSRRKSDKSTLYVVLGCKFKSSYYQTEDLKNGVERMFEKALQRYNKVNPAESISLKFVPLHAGYGEHLFNEIARDIISSDITVFETSDLAPNVFLEIGVALTWGARVFLIKREGCPLPPSDISGQTYADYRVSASYFTDSQHEEKLDRMVERAIRKKGY